MSAAITINGPNGMYSSVFFILVASKTILIIAPNKNRGGKTEDNYTL